MTYNDAVYFGSGKYFPKEPKPQVSIIFADGEDILLLQSESNGAWSVETKFTALQTNLEATLKQFE